MVRGWSSTGQHFNFSWNRRRKKLEIEIERVPFFAKNAPKNANVTSTAVGTDRQTNRLGYDVCVRSRNLLLRETELFSHECVVMSLVIIVVTM
jgi:hypothetical protein